MQGATKPQSPHKKTPMWQAPPSTPGGQGGDSEAEDTGGTAADDANQERADATPEAEVKRGTKVLEADQVEHPLPGGRWEGLGAVRKGAQIHMRVSAIAR